MASQPSALQRLAQQRAAQRATQAAPTPPPPPDPVEHGSGPDDPPADPEHPSLRSPTQELAHLSLASHSTGSVSPSGRFAGKPKSRGRAGQNVPGRKKLGPKTPIEHMFRSPNLEPGGHDEEQDVNESVLPTEVELDGSLSPHGPSFLLDPDQQPLSHMETSLATTHAHPHAPSGASGAKRAQGTAGLLSGGRAKLAKRNLARLAPTHLQPASAAGGPATLGSADEDVEGLQDTEMQGLYETSSATVPTLPTASPSPSPSPSPDPNPPSIPSASAFPPLGPQSSSAPLASDQSLTQPRKSKLRELAAKRATKQASSSGLPPPSTSSATLSSNPPLAESGHGASTEFGSGSGSGSGTPFGDTTLTAATAASSRALKPKNGPTFAQAATMNAGLSSLSEQPKSKLAAKLAAKKAAKAGPSHTGGSSPSPADGVREHENGDEPEEAIPVYAPSGVLLSALFPHPTSHPARGSATSHPSFIEERDTGGQPKLVSLSQPFASSHHAAPPQVPGGSPFDPWSRLDQRWAAFAGPSPDHAVLAARAGTRLAG